MFGQFPNQSKIEVFDTFCVTEAIASSAHGINFDSPLPTAKMLPKLGELSAKLGTGGQASVFASTLTWTSSTKASDTPAESCSATTAFQQQQAVAVKAFTGIRADENASNEQNMLEIVCALGIESNMVLPRPLSAQPDSISPSTPCLVYPKYCKDLFALLQDGALSNDAAARMTTSLLLATARLHQIGLVHLDLKHENILLTERNHPIVADFGFARCARADAPAIAAAISARCDEAAGKLPASLRLTAGAQSSFDAPVYSTLHLPACSDRAGSECHCAARREFTAGVTSVELLPGLPPSAYGVKPRDIALGAFAPPQCWLPVARIDGRKADGFAIGVIASYCLSQLGVGIDLARKGIVLADFPPQVCSAAIDFVRTATCFDEADRPTPEQLLLHPWVAEHASKLVSEHKAVASGCMHRWWEPVSQTAAPEQRHEPQAAIGNQEATFADHDSCSAEEAHFEQARSTVQTTLLIESDSEEEDACFTPVVKGKQLPQCSTGGHIAGSVPDTAGNPGLPGNSTCTRLIHSQSDGDLGSSEGQNHFERAQPFNMQQPGRQLSFGSRPSRANLRCASS